jgi:hypothetical protein
MPFQNEIQFEHLLKFMKPEQLNLFKSQLLDYKQIIMSNNKKLSENFIKFLKPITLDSSMYINNKIQNYSLYFFFK